MAIKAYMSRVEASRPYSNPPVEQAIREAKRILAEVEARDESGFSGHHPIGSFAPEYLLESLAAFVEGAI